MKSQLILQVLVPVLCLLTAGCSKSEPQSPVDSTEETVSTAIEMLNLTPDYISVSGIEMTMRTTTCTE